MPPTSTSALVGYPITEELLGAEADATTIHLPADMPGRLQAFVEANPMRNLVTAERSLLDGATTAGQIGSVLIASAALTAVFAPLTMHLSRTKI